MIKRKPALMLVLLGLLLYMHIGCDGPEPLEFNNPLDRESPNYTLPETTIIAGPAEGSTVNSAEVTFQWKGNPNVTEYSFQLDSTAWVKWSIERSVTFSNLDEGSHTFSVKGRYPNGVNEDATPAIRTFIVDAVKGPALILKPRSIKVRQGDEFTIQLIAEGVTDLMLAHLILTYDPSILRIGKVEQGDFLGTHGGTVIFFEDSSEAGRIDLNMGVGIGKPAGVDGSGILAQLKFIPLKPEQTTLKIEPISELRDSRNVTIPLNTWEVGVVQIE